MWQPAHLDICVSADGKSERKKASYTQRLCVSAIDAKGNTWATSYICQCECGSTLHNNTAKFRYAVSIRLENFKNHIILSSSISKDLLHSLSNKALPFYPTGCVLLH